MGKDQKLLEDDGKAVEDDRTPDLIGLKSTLECKNSFLRRTNLNVKGLEVWEKLLDSHALDKCLRILTLAFHACRMLVFKISLAESLERFPQVTTKIRQFLITQASRVSSLYLNKNNFSMKQNIYYSTADEVWFYRERMVDDGEQQLLEKPLIFLTVASLGGHMVKL